MGQFDILEEMRTHLKDDLPPIKPCPFCGNPYIDMEGYKSITVVCHKCKAEGPPVRTQLSDRFLSGGLTPYDAIRAAIAKWNERI